MRAFAPDRRVVRARRAGSAVFLLHGTVIGSWVPHIPMVKDRLGVDEAALGGLLLMMAAGAVSAFPLASFLVGRYGSRAITIATSALLAAALPLPVLSSTPAALASSLFVLGAANGASDVAMNAQAVVVERLYRRPILSSFHALYSTGGLLGATVAAIFLGAGASAIVHVACVTAACVAAIAVAAPALLKSPRSESRAGSLFVRPDRALFALGALAFLGLMAEGAMGDWSALYFRESLGTGAAVAGAAFAVFSFAMAAGRFAGDVLVSRFGAARWLRGSALLAAAGLGSALVAGNAAVAMIGWVAVGFGISNVVPILFRAAADSSTDRPERALAAVATTGYLGFLAGPPTIGVVSAATSLSWGLAVVALACAIIAAIGERAIRVPSNRLPRGVRR